MSGWTPEEIELREALIEEFSYVIPNERAQALECVLKTFEVLERLGWRKEPTLAEPGPCINGYAEHDWDQPASLPPTVCIRCDILKPTEDAN